MTSNRHHDYPFFLSVPRRCIRDRRANHVSAAPCFVEGKARALHFGETVLRAAFLYRIFTGFRVQRYFYRRTQAHTTHWYGDDAPCVATSDHGLQRQHDQIARLLRLRRNPHNHERTRALRGRFYRPCSKIDRIQEPRVVPSRRGQAPWLFAQQLQLRVVGQAIHDRPLRA